MAVIRPVGSLLLLSLSALALLYGLLGAPLLISLSLADLSLGPLPVLGRVALSLLWLAAALLSAAATAACSGALLSGHRAGMYLALIASAGWTLTGCAPIGIIVALLAWASGREA